MNDHRPAIERFLEQIEIDIAGCWLWTGKKVAETDYASFMVRSHSNGHRWSYEHFIGPIPDGLQIDHLCRVRHCVNPDHLEPVTNRENMLRGNHPTAISVRENKCWRGHELTPENTQIVKATGKRRCRICIQQRQRAWIKANPNYRTGVHS